nr:NAD kinase [Acidipropionibacterium timonense]
MSDPTEDVPRNVVVISHAVREDAFDAAGEFIAAMDQRGISSVVLADQRDALQTRVPGVPLTTIDPSISDPQSLRIEVVIVFGGDGTILRAAEWALPRHVPMLGVNLGHVGFLAELERSDMSSLVRQVCDRDYTVEDRLVLEVRVTDHAGREHWRSFAVNEMSLEKASRRRMLDVLASVDGLPVQRWSCDGILVSTPTGSTAYAFSAGGPVMWPDVEAMLMLPLSAHALFARPLVMSPNARVDLDVQPDGTDAAVLWCDGRRSCEVRPGERVTVVRHDARLRIARLAEQPFTSRLVKKFALPVDGWRQGQGRG